MKKKSKLKALMQYLPNRRVLDVVPPFDDDISQPLFHKGNQVGCITLHGIGGTPANVRVVSDALIREGYTVISPMLPGHGTTVRQFNQSTGEAWLQAALDAYDRLRMEGCTQIYALGLSLGGILSGLIATQRKVDGLVLFCAPIEMQPYLHMARRISWLVPVVSYGEKNLFSRWQDNPYEQMYDGFSTKKLVDLNRLCIALRKNLDQITCPTLLFTAKYDDKVDIRSVDIWNAGAIHVPSCEQIELERSPHGCTYGIERDFIAQKAVTFIAAQVDKSAAASL